MIPPLVAASVLGALLALAGCGAAQPAEPPAPVGVFPATVTHRYGQTTVPAAPQRVVSLGFTDQDALLALGTVPVAVREFTGNRPSATWPWAADRLKGAQPQVLPAQGVTPDVVAALRPDLIVAISAGLSREEYEAYSTIAPTVAAPDGFPDYATPWEDATRLTGAALGLPGEADRLVRDVEERFIQAEEKHPELAGATVAAVRAKAGDTGAFYAWSSKDPRGQFLRELGASVPTEVDQLADGGVYATVPTEQLSTLDRADALVVIGDEAQRRAFTALPGYAELGLVRDSKVVTLDDEQAAALAFGSVLSLPAVVDDVSGRIERAVER